MNKPNFFIIGAPKCGTTALSEYLNNHPDIFISNPKEPHYFASDLPGYQYVQSFDDYLKLFDNVNTYKRIGEASVYYLYSKTAIQNILQYDKEARFIVMLRRPDQMIYSLHSQLLYSRNENIIDFEKAWRYQKYRREGKYIPRYCTDSKILYYREVGLLGEQIERLFNIVCQSKVKIVFFDDFISDTKVEYQNVLKFLNVENDSRSEFPVINENTRHRISTLAGLYVNTPYWLSSAVGMLKKVIGYHGRFNLSNYLLELNTIKVKRKPLSVKMKTELLSAFKEDIEKLSILTGRNLSDWLL